MSTNSLNEFKELDIEPLIADRPADPRDSSRLLVVNRKTGELLDKHFYDLPDMLPKDTLLILNNSKVWKAKLESKKIPGGGHCELLLTGHLNESGTKWAALCRKMKAGQSVECNGGLIAACEGMNETGAFVFNFKEPLTDEYLQKYGEVPLPQYILNARKRRHADAPPDDDKYQTIYANPMGSIAAPTAGFHFTENVFKNLETKGIEKEFVTLHIGWGTFKPVRAEDPAQHIMMKEACQLSKSISYKINAHIAAGKTLAAVGTSSMRTLETFAYGKGKAGFGMKEAGLFIYPGYEFKTADIFITNLHVPESAPLYMTAAFAGRELLFKAYKHAVESKYRFYSYGDSMLIL